MLKICVKEAQIGKYKSSLYWYKTADGVWIDNSYFVRIEDLEGNLIEEIDNKRTDVPDVSMPPARAVLPPPPTTISKEPILIDPNNDFWIFTKKPPRPITVWITFNKETGERKIIDVVTGETIGYGTSPPIEGYSWSGPHNDNDVWFQWRENADRWFQKWCSETITKGLATVDEIQSGVHNPYAKYYYAIAHGTSTGATAVGGTLLWRDIEESMLDREPMWFAFLGHCGAMANTGSGSFSHAFRKGTLIDTVTIGYINMGSCSGWVDSLAWQGKLFNLVDEGSTFKDAFDRATVTYPRIESGVKFIGDESIGKKEVNGMNVRRIDLWLKKAIEGETWTIHGTLKDIDNNTGIGDATIMLDGATTTTTIDGDFLFGSIPTGQHTLTAACAGYKDTNDPTKPSSVTFVL